MDLETVFAALALSERRGRWLEAAAELTVALQPPLEHELALERTAQAVLPLTRARAVVVGTITEEGAVAGVALRRPEDDAPVRRALRRLTDILPAGFVEPIDFEIDEFRVLTVALDSALAARGAIAVFYDEHADLPDPDELRLLAGFGRQAGLALDRAQAVGDRADLAVVVDRERIARDLHDVVIQRLFATGLQLQALGRLTDDRDFAERLSTAVDALDLTIRDIRATVFELDPDPGTSLRAQMREVVRESVGALGFRPTLRTAGPVDSAVTWDVRAHVLPVLREALSNVARHARATSAQIELAVGAGELVLLVRDDGVGIAHPSDETAESGLHHARERAAQLGGSLDLLPRTSHGTVFRWMVPLPRR